MLLKSMVLANGEGNCWGGVFYDAEILELEGLLGLFHFTFLI